MSPRFAIACSGSAWDRGSYNFSTGTPNGDAPRSNPAVLSFGDAKPDQVGELGHTTLGSLGDDGMEPGDTGLGAVYGLAYSSGTNPAIPAVAPADARRARLFAAAFHKRITRYGVGGPGGVYILDRVTNSERLYVQVPAVIPGSSAIQPGPAGFPNTPGDGQAVPFPNAAVVAGYTPEMGGVHSLEHDYIGEGLAGRIGLGDIEMSPSEQYLVTVNLNNQRIYIIDTWAANPQASMFSFAINQAAAACPGGVTNFRPFGLHYDPDSNFYVGYVCSGESSGNRANLRAGVLRYGPVTAFAWVRVLDMDMTSFDAARAGFAPVQWQTWRNDFQVKQPILADIEIAEDGSMVLGFRDRASDLGGNSNLPSAYATGNGDMLRALPNGAGGWSAPAPAEYFAPDDAPSDQQQESIWGATSYVPGNHAGGYGGEVVTSMGMQYRQGTGNAGWFDIATGQRTGVEEVYSDSSDPAAFSKASGLGDIELLCVWRAIGNRVWRDSNGNGVQDAGEPDITGVRLQLLNTGGSLLATVTTGNVTGAGDLWRFYVAPFQNYQVRIDPAMFNLGQPLYGLSLTAANQGGSDATDSDADGGGVVAVGAGPRSEINLNYDFGLADGTNIRVTKSGTATALPNGTISYSMVVTNDGPGIARNVAVVDTLPAGVSYAGANPAPTSQSGNTVSWSLGDLGVGSSTTLTLNATVASATRGSVTNSVTISTSSSGDSPGDNTDTHTTTIIVPNVFVNKSGTATVLPGGNISYTLAYGNNGTAAAANVTLVDTLPPGTTLVSANPAPTSQSGSTLTWAIGTVNVGQSGSITLVARAASNATAGTVLTNQVTISTSTSGDSPGDNTSTSTTTVIAPNVRVNKTGPATSLPGGLVDYTISYDNNGNAAAAGVSVVDTLPAGATFVSATPAPTSQSGSTLSWAIGTVNAGAGGAITLRVQFNPSLARGAVLTNNVTISTTTSGDNPADNTDDHPVTVVSPNVRVTKTGPVKVTAGDQLTYSVSYDNNGTAPAAGVRIVDTLPAGVTFVSATPAPTSQSGSTLTWAIGTVNAGASATIAVVVQANAALTSGATLTNGVTISTTTSGDTPSDNRSSWDTLVERADVAMVKSSPSTFPAPAGTLVTYYLDYANNGPATARSVVLTDTVPGQLIGVSWSCSAGCAVSGSGSSITVNLGDLAAGASGRIVVTGTAMTSVAREDFTNTARISTITPETTLTNNESSVPGAVWTSDLLIIKAAAPFAVAGSTFTATLTIRNQGPASATTVQVQDTLPPGVTFVASSPAPTSSVGATYRWNLGTLGDLEERTITLTLRADASLDGGVSVVNTATTSGTSDRDPGNNTDDSTTIIRRRADIRIQKDGPARVTAGNQIAYTLAYANDGPSAARAVIVTDMLPAGVTFVSATPAPSSQSGSTLTWAVGDLSVGQSGTINVTVATEPVQMEPAITVVNRATITDGGSDLPGGGGANDDPTPGNNEDEHRTDIETSDVFVRKDMPDFIVAGLAFDATVRVENRGPADALNVTLRDFLPPGMTLVSASPPVSAAPARWNLGTISAGQSITITLRLRVPSTAPRDALFVNRVIVDTTTPDRDETNNIHEDSTRVRPNADLSVVKDGPAGPILSGATVTYTLRWANAGPSLAEAVEVRDPLPAGFTFQRATPAPTGMSAGVLTWALGNQDVGAAGTITVVGQLVTSQASESKVNTATVASTTDDPAPSNNTDDSTTTVQTVDLSVVKTGNPAIARAGAPYTYTLTIRNAGPASATSVVVSDTLPPSLTFLDATPLPTTRSGQTLTWNLGPLASGAARTVTLAVHISTAARGRLVNTATVGSPEPDRDPNNNTSTHTTDITAEADLSIVKDGPAGPIRSGSVVTYTLRYQNRGPALANAVIVTDTLPAGFTLTSANPAPTRQSGNLLIWAVGDVESGNSGTLFVAGRLIGDGVSTNRVNVARVDSSTTDTVPGNNEDDHPLTVRKPDLSITKSNGVSSAQAGDLLAYRIIVTNSGMAAATGVVVTETPPAGAVQAGDGWRAGDGGAYTQTLPQLGAGQVVTLTLRVQLANPLPAGMARALNLVTVTDDGSTGPDPTPDDTSSRDDDPLIWGTVGDLVWIDRNRNGIPDPGEPGLGNVPLELLDPVTGEILARVITDANGGYVFDGLRLGRYAIQIAPSALDGALAEYQLTTAPMPVTALTAAQREDRSLDIGLYSPTSAVDLTYLKVERQGDGTVLIRWGTLNERDTARFIVKRTTTKQLTANAVIVGQRASLGSAGGDYRVTDTSAPAPAAGTRYYWLVELETDGTENVYGPASTAPLTTGTMQLYLPLVRN